jgi:polyphosphate glucokinase
VSSKKCGTCSAYGRGTVEDHLGARGLRKLGKRQWRKTVEWAVIRFVSAFLLDDVVIGGGNAKKLKKAPPGCRLGNNANAFLGGFRMWENPVVSNPPLGQ